MDIGQIALIAAIVVFMIIRRFLGQPLQAKSLVVPTLLTVWGIYQLRHDHVTALDAGFLAVSAVVGLAAGAARGTTIKIFSRDGHLWHRYRPVTLAVWVGTVLLRLGMSAGGHLAGVDLDTEATLLVMFGISLFAESGIVAIRAARTGVPYAPGRGSVDADGRRRGRRRSSVAGYR
jgi:hypothetical protein